jgi:hypothetical protein
MKILDTTVVALTIAWNALIVLPPDIEPFAIALGGSFSGAMTLIYFRREISRFEMFLKSLVSTLAGFVLGSVTQEYLHLETRAYRLGLFYLVGMVSVAICRAVLATTENNAGEVCRAAMLRLISPWLTPQRVRAYNQKSNGRKIKRLKNGQFITLPKTDGDAPVNTTTGEK